MACPRHGLSPVQDFHCSVGGAGAKTSLQLSPELLPLSPGWLEGSSQNSEHLQGLPLPCSRGLESHAQEENRNVRAWESSLSFTVLCRLCLCAFPVRVEVRGP